MSLAGLRLAWMARGVVGLSASEPTRDAFAALVAPGEDPVVAGQMIDTMSTCGLTVRGLWHRMGMSDPRLEAPYAPGSVMTTIRDMANEAGAWSDGWTRPSVGDVLYVSEPDHVGVIVSLSYDGDGGATFTTVDGGSTDAAGKQAIVKWDRAVNASGELTAGPLAGNGRSVVGSVDVGAVAARFGGALVPLVALAAVGAGGWWAYKHKARVRSELTRAERFIRRQL